MEESPGRFSCLLEPTGDWTVWDEVTGEPANLGGKILIGCTRERAESARDVLTRIYKNGLTRGPRLAVLARVDSPHTSHPAAGCRANLTQ